MPYPVKRKSKRSKIKRSHQKKKRRYQKKKRRYQTKKNRIMKGGAGAGAQWYVCNVSDSGTPELLYFNGLVKRVIEGEGDEDHYTTVMENESNFKVVAPGGRAIEADISKMDISAPGIKHYLKPTYNYLFEKSRHGGTPPGGGNPSSSLGHPDLHFGGEDGVPRTPPRRGRITF